MAKTYGFIINSPASKAIVDVIAGKLRSGTGVKVTGLGVFRVRDARARAGVNPQTGERIKIPARRRVAFRASKLIKDAVA